MKRDHFAQCLRTHPGNQTPSLDDNHGILMNTAHSVKEKILTLKPAKVMYLKTRKKKWEELKQSQKFKQKTNKPKPKTIYPFLIYLLIKII